MTLLSTEPFHQGQWSHPVVDPLPDRVWRHPVAVRCRQVLPTAGAGTSVGELLPAREFALHGHLRPGAQSAHAERGQFHHALQTPTLPSGQTRVEKFGPKLGLLVFWPNWARLVPNGKNIELFKTSANTNFGGPPMPFTQYGWIKYQFNYHSYII